MKAKIIKIFWGIFLIALGGLSLADRLGYINLDSISSQTWVIIFACCSVAFFISYVLSGFQKWGWLFPTLIFAALSVTIGDLEQNRNDWLIPLVILLSIAIPFYAGYLANRKHWALLIPAWILTVTAVIPGLDEHINGNIIGAIFLYATALPFLLVYLANKLRKWALIIGVILGAIGTMPLLDYFASEEVVGPMVMLLFTLIFLTVYFATRKWWAIIPAGAFASIGLVALLDTLIPNRDYILIGKLEIGSYSSVLLLGIAITFVVLWLLRKIHPTRWAIYPAIGSFILAALVLVLGRSIDNVLPALIPLVFGVVMIVAAVRKEKIGNPSST